MATGETHNPSKSGRWNSAPIAWFQLGSKLCLARSSDHSTGVTPKFLQSLDQPESGVRPCFDQPWALAGRGWGTCHL